MFGQRFQSGFLPAENDTLFSRLRISRPRPSRGRRPRLLCSPVVNGSFPGAFLGSPGFQFVFESQVGQHARWVHACKYWVVHLEWSVLGNSGQILLAEVAPEGGEPPAFRKFPGRPGPPGRRPGLGHLLRGNTGAAASGRAASRKGGREFSKVWKIPPGRNWLWKTSDLTPPSDVGAQLISLSTTASGGSWHMGVCF